MMKYSDLISILAPGTIIHVGTPYIAGIGIIEKITPTIIVLSPYIIKDKEEEALPEKTLLKLEDLNIIFILTQKSEK